MTINSDSNSSFESDKLILKLSIQMSADHNAVDSVVQSIMEVLANAVVHGAKADPSKIIECDVACDENHRMLIVVRDPGEGFDPSSIPNPVMGENLYSNHGRGIYLINQLMDEVKYLKNGTEIQMIKK
jgi:serine/threonine-protein kinase RsbW